MEAFIDRLAVDVQFCYLAVFLLVFVAFNLTGVINVAFLSTTAAVLWLQRIIFVNILGANLIHSVLLFIIETASL